MVICLERGADLHMAQLIPLTLTVSCSSKIQIGFSFLVPAHLGNPGQRAVKRMCVCVCIRGLAVTPADANCTTEWARTPRWASFGTQYHRRASNVNECQKACEFDPRCVAVDWRRNNRRCWINTNPNYRLRASAFFGKQYRDVSARVAGCISC